MSTESQIGAPDLREIEAAAHSGDRNRAIDLAIAALGRKIRHPSVLELVAEGLEEDGRLKDAAGLLFETIEKEPQRLSALRAFARVLVKDDRHGEALAAQLQILALDPDDFDARMEAGKMSMILGDVPGGRRHYGRAAELAPDSSHAWGALAIIGARQGDSKTARSFGERALSLHPESIGAQIAIARADLAEGAPEAAKERLEHLLRRPDLPEVDRPEALNYVGDALDALDRPQDAFAVYNARSAMKVRGRADTIKEPDKERAFDQAKRLAAYFRAASLDPSTYGAGEDREGAATVRGHVFMVGFPRSGTTLLEQVLASHPDVVALEERRMLTEAADHLLTDDAAVDRLVRLTVAGADACRQVYWHGVREAFGADVSNKVFIDKNPLNTARLPVIAKLFPKAKIILAARDPRDVVLSAYRRLYYSLMLEFLTLEGTANYYDQVMGLQELYRKRLHLDVHTIRHEDLVVDFEGETRKVLQFIGVDWDDSVRGFAARAADSATPSAGQVTRGLNAEGVGQWRRYARELAPVLPLLEPWVKRLGYPATDPDLMPAPEDPRLPSVLARIGAAMKAGDWTMAFSDVDRALAAGMKHPLFYRLRGVRAQQQGRLDEAISDFETALAETPGDFSILSALGLCLARNGQTDGALARLESAIAIAPAYAPAHYNRGWTLESMGELAGARESYLGAIAIDPTHAQALASLASIAGRVGDYKGARGYAQRALALDPRQPIALTALANVEAAEGDPAGARRRLEALIAPGSRASDHERAVAQGLLGDVLDELDQPRDAFRAYESSASAFRTLYAHRHTGRGQETSLGLARRLAEHFRDARPADWRRSAAAAGSAGAAGHVFLLSFPRSGATMLGQALATIPDVVTLEEQNFLAAAEQDYLFNPEGVGALPTLSKEAVTHFQDLYWRRIEAAAGETAGKVVVDKLPMNTLALPLIVKLFPRAKVLFLRRDPRDVVFSCFRRRFELNPTTVEFLTLAGAASLYDQVMSLMEVYRGVLDLDLRIQGYEDLVGDFDGETRAICDFAGIAWRAEMADFSGRASNIATPSAGQLARGLNADSVGQWRRYRDEMAPVLPILAPWVERFGYAPD